jgi:hypothetical protein
MLKTPVLEKIDSPQNIFYLSASNFAKKLTPYKTSSIFLQAIL